MVLGVRVPRLSEAVRSAAGRMSWGLGDQAVSSLTNFAVGIVVARSLGAAEFGIFSLAWVTYAVVLNLSRGLATDPLTVRHNGEPDARWRAAVSSAANSVLAVGLVTGVISVLAGLTLRGELGAAFVALGVVLPVLLVQDSWRYAFFAVGQGRRAVFNDLVWAAALVPAMLVAGTYGSVAAFVLAWGAAAGVAALFGCAQTRLLPTLSGVASWIRAHRDLNLRYMGENISTPMAAQIRMYGLGALAGLADVGAVRGAQLLLGPFLALLMGMSLVSVVEAARVLRRSPGRLSRFCLVLGGGQAAAGLAFGLALMLVLPDTVGRELLGSVWPAASALILPTMLMVMAGSLSDGAAAGLRALGASRRSLRAKIVSAGGYVVGGLVGAAMAGALGSAWGVAVGVAVGAVVAWRELRVAQARALIQAPAPHPGTPGPQDHHNEQEVRHP